MNADDTSDCTIKLNRIGYVPGMARERGIQIRDEDLRSGEEAGGPARGDAHLGKQSPMSRKSDNKRKRVSDIDDEAPGMKKISPLKTPEKSPNMLTSYYKSNRSPEKTPDKNGGDAAAERLTGKVHLSPKIMKENKRFKIKDMDPVIENEMGSITELDYNEFCFEDSYVDEKKEIKVLGSSGRYSASLKKIVRHELDNQAELRERAAKDGRTFAELLSEAEVKCFRELFDLPHDACELLARMLCRKKSWHIVSTIEYEYISERIEDVLRKLGKTGYADLDVGRELLDARLALLRKKDIQIICKKMKIKTAAGLKKEDLIKTLIKNCRTQRSVVDAWEKSGGTSGRLAILDGEVNAALGTCVRINTSVWEMLDRLLLLFSFTHSTDCNEWATEIKMVMESDYVPYPKYEVNPSVIFQTRNDFLLYEKAVKLMWDLKVALQQKNTEDFFKIEEEAKKMFYNLLKDHEYQERLTELPTFLRKYSAGCVCVHILTKCCDNNKRQQTPEELINVAKSLVDQRVFLPGKRGVWFSCLAQVYKKTGDIAAAASSLVRGLKDEGLDEVQRHELKLRGQALLMMRKADSSRMPEIWTELNELCKTDVEDPKEVEIVARLHSCSRPGNKVVYMEVVGGGDKDYLSSEELAISHYKRNGFTKGVHCEGYIMQTVYCLLFFDIIYNSSVPGVFQSPYQDAPLDFWSKSFYDNRKDLIDHRLAEIRSWTESEISGAVEESFNANRGLRCIITWKDEFTPEVFSEIILCLGSSAVTSICERLATHYKVFSSGFPDLIVWDPTKRICKLVEVKSHNDRLSVRQRLWLHYLRTRGVDCEVLKIRDKR